MTRVVLIQAGPTPWDQEERVSGNHTLPLTPDARAAIAALVDTLPPIDAIYRCKSNEACDEVARMLARRFGKRPRDNPDLDAWGLGLWQGLRHEDARQRYPKAYEQWIESPASVVPPDGEPFVAAIERLRGALKKILRRNRGYTIAIPLRPLAMQITAGVLRGETPEQIAAHLRNESPAETIDLQE